MRAKSNGGINVTYRGYLKDSGGAKRLRFVMPGYDADDENVPPNKVIFDSNNIGTLSILHSGVYSWDGSAASQQWVTIATWPALSFVPLCHFLYRHSVYPSTDVRTQNFLPFRSGTGSNVASLADNMIRVKNNGIDLKYYASATGVSLIYWYAFNIKAA